jgi:uncharacterized protein
MPVNFNFEWDPIKARANLDKHSVAFDEAASVFKNPRAISIFDPDHSETEDRCITMGISEKGRLLIVIHTFLKESEDTIIMRIITSRKATRHETANYGE